MPNKKTKKEPKKAEIIEKKEKKDIKIDPNDKVSLRTRMSLSKFFDVVSILNKEQKKAVKEMGLGSLLRVAINGIPGKLSRFVVNSFEPKDMKMHLPLGTIDVTEDLVHDILGVPKGGEELYDIDQCSPRHLPLLAWKEQFEKGTVRPGEIEDRITESPRAGLMFKINFVMLFINTLCELNKPGTCKLTALPHLFGNIPIKRINWCRFIVDRLTVSKMMWDETGKNDVYCGPLVVLLVNIFHQFHNFISCYYRKLIKYILMKKTAGLYGVYEKS